MWLGSWQQVAWDLHEMLAHFISWAGVACIGHMEGPMAFVNRLRRGPFGVVGGSAVKPIHELLQQGDWAAL